MTIRGLDISVIQGTVDFQAVAASGIQFIVARCGIGNSGIDVDYTKNITAAKASGLQVACYHFVYPLPTTAAQPLRDPVKQAQYHFSAAQGVLACMDFEWPVQTDWAKWGCSAQQISDWGLTYLAEYSRLDGRTTLIYTYPNFAQTVNLAAAPTYASYPLWIASYQATPYIPAPWNSWTLWQTSGGGGKLPNGAPVDTDVAQDLSLWLPPIPTVVTPPPPVIAPPAPVSVPPTPPPAPPPANPSPIDNASVDNLLTNITDWIKKL
jgi:lysozyme